MSISCYLSSSKSDAHSLHLFFSLIYVTLTSVFVKDKFLFKGKIHNVGKKLGEKGLQ